MANTWVMLAKKAGIPALILGLVSFRLKADTGQGINFEHLDPVWALYERYMSVIWAKNN